MPAFLWDRSATLGLAKASCVFCHGYGLLPVLRGTELACKCVYRSIFRAVLRRFTECLALAPHTSGVTWERAGGPSGYRCYARKREEFCADFCLLAKRTLLGLEAEVFRLHFEAGRNWHACCRRLVIDRGEFFHTVYRCEVRMGRVFAETLPYPLYPVAEYFAGIGVVEAFAPRPPLVVKEWQDAEPILGAFRWRKRRRAA